MPDVIIVGTPVAPVVPGVVPVDYGVFTPSVAPVVAVDAASGAAPAVPAAAGVGLAVSGSAAAVAVVGPGVAPVFSGGGTLTGVSLRLEFSRALGQPMSRVPVPTVPIPVGTTHLAWAKPSGVEFSQFEPPQAAGSVWLTSVEDYATDEVVLSPYSGLAGFALNLEEDSLFDVACVALRLV